MCTRKIQQRHVVPRCPRSYVDLIERMVQKASEFQEHVTDNSCSIDNGNFETVLDTKLSPAPIVSHGDRCLVKYAYADPMGMLMIQA